jgi:FixJ family two-component response regulator
VLPSDKARPLVAVVDDEDCICRALMRLLSAAGLDVATYLSGTEFLDSLRGQRPPDCVIVDIHMPHVSGFDVQTTLSRMHPAIPVIAMTGRHREEARQAMLAAGAVAYLHKPVDERTLLDAVTAAISGQAGRAVARA